MALALAFASVNAYASAKLSCPMADGSSFEFDGRHIGIGSAVLGLITMHSASPSDPYKFAYQVEYRPRSGEHIELPFRDDDPKCEHYSSANGMVTAYSSRGVQRLQGQNKDIWSPLFMVSHDGGKTFGPNVHPFARGRLRKGEYAPFPDGKGWADTQMVRIHDSQYSIEYISFTAERFSLYKSNDKGKTWIGPLVSQDFEVFSPEVVNAKRNEAARREWFNAQINAQNLACKPPQPLLGCAVETEKYWNKQWNDCLDTDLSPYECVRSLPKPYPIKASAAQ